MKSLAVTHGKRNFALAFGKGASPKGSRRQPRSGAGRHRGNKTAKKFAVTEIIRNFAEPFRRKKDGAAAADARPDTEDTETITIDKRDEVVQEPQGASPAGLVNYRVETG